VVCRIVKTDSGMKCRSVWDGWRIEYWFFRLYVKIILMTLFGKWSAVRFCMTKSLRVNEMVGYLEAVG